MFTMQSIEMFVCVGWEVQCGWVGGWEQSVKATRGREEIGIGIEQKKSRKRKVKEIGKRRGEQAESRR